MLVMQYWPLASSYTLAHLNRTIAPYIAAPTQVPPRSPMAVELPAAPLPLPNDHTTTAIGRAGIDRCAVMLMCGWVATPNAHLLSVNQPRPVTHWTFQQNARVIGQRSAHDSGQKQRIQPVVEHE